MKLYSYDLIKYVLNTFEYNEEFNCDIDVFTYEPEHYLKISNNNNKHIKLEYDNNYCFYSADSESAREALTIQLKDGIYTAINSNGVIQYDKGSTPIDKEEFEKAFKSFLECLKVDRG